MSLPTNIDHRLVIKNYLQEAIKHSADKDLADTRLKAVFESVKESEEALKELIQVHTIESRIKVINSVSDNNLLGIR